MGNHIRKRIIIKVDINKMKKKFIIIDRHDQIKKFKGGVFIKMRLRDLLDLLYILNMQKRSMVYLIIIFFIAYFFSSIFISNTYSFLL